MPGEITFRNGFVGLPHPVSPGPAADWRPAVHLLTWVAATDVAVVSQATEPGRCVVYLRWCGDLERQVPLSVAAEATDVIRAVSLAVKLENR